MLKALPRATRDLEPARCVPSMTCTEVRSSSRFQESDEISTSSVHLERVRDHERRDRLVGGSCDYRCPFHQVAPLAVVPVVSVVATVGVFLLGRVGTADGCERGRRRLTARV